MSTLKTSAIQSPDSDVPQISLSASGMTFAASALALEGGSVDLPAGSSVDGNNIATEGYVTASAAPQVDPTFTGTVDMSNANLVPQYQLGNRNMVYNGAMQVHQRGTSQGGITGAGYYTADRWALSINSFATWTQSVENDGPPGFAHSFKMLATAAESSPGASDFCIIAQLFEGQDLQRIKKGTSEAQQITVSFWLKTNASAETFICELADIDNGRRVSKSYSTTAADTWEYKTITFPADTTGTLDNNNNSSLNLIFWLGGGSTFTGGSKLGEDWHTTNSDRAVGQVNLSSLTFAGGALPYWQITGVQMEVGPVATPFEHKAYGQELAECQRYYESRAAAGYAGGFVGKTASAGGGSGRIFVPFLVEKRASPTVNSATVRNSNTGATATVSAGTISTFGCAYSTGGVTGSVGDAMHLNTALTIDAEL